MKVLVQYWWPITNIAYAPNGSEIELTQEVLVKLLEHHDVMLRQCQEMILSLDRRGGGFKQR